MADAHANARGDADPDAAAHRCRGLYRKMERFDRLYSKCQSNKLEDSFLLFQALCAGLLYGGIGVEIVTHGGFDWLH